MTVSKLYTEEIANGDRFQRELAELAVAEKCKTIVETGYGVSTLFLLHYLEHSMNMESARVYSVDPNPWYPKRVTSSQHELILQRSTDALPDLYKRTGPWDMFLHDGNHDILCMTYDLHFAYACLRNGGIIACDDCGWAGHKAWELFVDKNRLSVHRCGSVNYGFKSGEPMSVTAIDGFHSTCLALAQTSEYVWLAAGNKNSAAFAK